MKMVYTKGNQVTIFTIQSNGDYEIENKFYLTAYKRYGCSSKRIVGWNEAEEIMNRLTRKGFSFSRQ